MDFSKIGGLLAQVAPTIATAVGGPVAGMAVKALSSALLGKENGSQSEIETAMLNATPEQLAMVKKVDNDLAIKMKELDINLEQIKADDRRSARDMMMSSNTDTPAILSYFVLVSWVGVQYFLLTHVVDPGMRELVARVLGTLDGALMMMFSFWFGASFVKGK